MLTIGVSRGRRRRSVTGDGGEDKGRGETGGVLAFETSWGACLR